MTERTLSTLPPIAQSQHASNSPYPHNFESALVAADSGAEEPYTIKCICKLTHADTETICCDKCETWQHFECYYTGDFAAASADDFEHECVECHPRFIDTKRIKEQQKLRHDKLERQSRLGEEKKAKRPQSKSHKKSKPSEVVTNGTYGHDGGHDGRVGVHEQTKRTKSQHKSRDSISSPSGTKRSPSTHSRKPSYAHPLSPATTPPELPNDFVVHTYSDQFQYMWQTDPGPAELQANSFASLTVTNTMSEWVHDERKLQQDAGVLARDAFQTLKPDVDLSKYNAKLIIRDRIVNVRGTDVRYRYLTNKDSVRTPQQLLGELKGIVGFQRNYFEENTEAWAKNCHPAPFVFFPPNLPLYIDTRREGSACRYVRRSCRPNASLDTFITNGSEYHFYFVNDSGLQSGEQIAMPWEFRFPPQVEKRYLRILGLSDESDGTEDQELTDEEYQHLSETINNVLSDYGGCACDLENECAFVRFHRNYHAKLIAQTQPKRTKKVRKTKQHVSPASTGHATNSRDTSEGHNDDAEDERCSHSGSIKPRSRDMTPAVNGVPVSDRDKRKLADIEKSFEQLDKQPPKKKKRGSDGPLPLGHSASGHPSTQRPKTKGISRSTTTTYALGKDSKNASTRASHSPATGVSPKTRPTSVSGQGSRYGAKRVPSGQATPVRKVQYAEAGCQTEPDPEATWYAPPHQQKKKFVPLSRRLIQNHRLQYEREQARRAAVAEQMELAARMQSVTATPSPLPAQTRMGSAMVVNAINGTLSPVSTQKANDQSAPVSPDVVMTDVSATSMPPPPAWPGVLKPITANSSTGTQSDQRPADLTIQLPPNNVNLTATPSPLSGMSALQSPASVMQSPLGKNYPSQFSPSMQASVGNPMQPVKKKLSLKDYNSMKKAASATPAQKTENVVPTLRTASSLSEESKAPALPEKPASAPIAPVADTKFVDTIMADAPPLATTAEAKPSAPTTSL